MAETETATAAKGTRAAMDLPLAVKVAAAVAVSSVVDLPQVRLA
jgi:hypothetical protein